MNKIVRRRFMPICTLGAASRARYVPPARETTAVVSPRGILTLDLRGLDWCGLCLRCDVELQAETDTCRVWLHI